MGNAQPQTGPALAQPRREEGIEYSFLGRRIDSCPVFDDFDMSELEEGIADALEDIEINVELDGLHEHLSDALSEIEVDIDGLEGLHALGQLGELHKLEGLGELKVLHNLEGLGELRIAGVLAAGPIGLQDEFGLFVIHADVSDYSNWGGAQRLFSPRKNPCGRGEDAAVAVCRAKAAT